jgi:hypothetical protein
MKEQSAVLLKITRYSSALTLCCYSAAREKVTLQRPTYVQRTEQAIFFSLLGP